MRILFVYSVRYSVLPDQPLLDLESVHLGLSCIVETVRSQGHATRLAVLGSRDAPKRTAEVIEAANAEFDPQIIAFTSVSTELPFIHSLARRIKAQWPGKYLIIGGVHATLNPQSVMQDTFDALCVGEGEQPLAELAEQLGAGKSPSGIPNLWIRRADGTIEQNPTIRHLSRLGDVLSPPATATGADRFVVDPSPSCWSPFFPQHRWRYDEQSFWDRRKRRLVGIATAKGIDSHRESSEWTRNGQTSRH